MYEICCRCCQYKQRHQNYLFYHLHTYTCLKYSLNTIYTILVGCLVLIEKPEVPTYEPIETGKRFIISLTVYTWLARFESDIFYNKPTPFKSNKKRVIWYAGRYHHKTFQIYGYHANAQFYEQLFQFIYLAVNNLYRYLE